MAKCGYGSELFSALSLAFSKCPRRRAEKLCNPAINSLSPCKMCVNGSLCNEFYGPDNILRFRLRDCALVLTYTSGGLQGLQSYTYYFMHPTRKYIKMGAANKRGMCPSIMDRETMFMVYPLMSSPSLLDDHWEFTIFILHLSLFKSISNSA